MNLISKKLRSLLLHPFVKGGLVVMGGAMAANVSAYLYHLIVGRILGPVAYGELAALLALFFILNVPSSVLQTISVKFFPHLGHVMNTVRYVRYL